MRLNEKLASNSKAVLSLSLASDFRMGDCIPHDLPNTYSGGFHPARSQRGCANILARFRAEKKEALWREKSCLRTKPLPGREGGEPLESPSERSGEGRRGRKGGYAVHMKKLFKTFGSGKAMATELNLYALHVEPYFP